LPLEILIIVFAFIFITRRQDPEPQCITVHVEAEDDMNTAPRSKLRAHTEQNSSVSTQLRKRPVEELNAASSLQILCGLHCVWSMFCCCFCGCGKLLRLKLPPGAHLNPCVTVALDLFSPRVRSALLPVCLIYGIANRIWEYWFVRGAVIHGRWRQLLLERGYGVYASGTASGAVYLAMLVLAGSFFMGAGFATLGNSIYHSRRWLFLTSLMIFERVPSFCCMQKPEDIVSITILNMCVFALILLAWQAVTGEHTHFDKVEARCDEYTRACLKPASSRRSPPMHYPPLLFLGALLSVGVLLPTGCSIMSRVQVFRDSTNMVLSRAAPALTATNQEIKAQITALRAFAQSQNFAPVLFLLSVLPSNIAELVSESLQSMVVDNLLGGRFAGFQSVEGMSNDIILAVKLAFHMELVMVLMATVLSCFLMYRIFSQFRDEFIAQVRGESPHKMSPHVKLNPLSATIFPGVLFGTVLVGYYLLVVAGAGISVSIGLIVILKPTWEFFWSDLFKYLLPVAMLVFAKQALNYLWFTGFLTDDMGTVTRPGLFSIFLAVFTLINTVNAIFFCTFRYVTVCCFGLIYVLFNIHDTMISETYDIVYGSFLNLVRLTVCEYHPIYRSALRTICPHVHSGWHAPVLSIEDGTGAGKGTVSRKRVNARRYLWLLVTLTNNPELKQHRVHGTVPENAGSKQ